GHERCAQAVRAARGAVLLGLAIVSSAWPARADDMATLHRRVVDSYIATSAPAGDTGAAAAQTNITSQATSLLAKLQATGAFSDLAYTDQPAVNWSVGTH